MTFKKVMGTAVASACVLAMSVSALADGYGVASEVKYSVSGASGETAIIELTGLNYEGDLGEAAKENASYWNDWCVIGIQVDHDGTTDYYAAVGSQVGWDITVSDNGTADNKDDDVIIPVAECTKFDGKDATVAVSVGADYTITVFGIGWADTDASKITPFCEVTSVTVDGTDVTSEGAVKTGDTTPVIAIGALALVAGAAMVATKKFA